MWLRKRTVARVALWLLVSGVTVWFLSRQGCFGHSQPLEEGDPLHAFARIQIPDCEVSGIVPSHRHEGVFWVHNDSGDRPRLFAVDSQGKLLSPRSGVTVAGALNRDWEDLAWAGDELLIGDIGNNAQQRSELQFYRVPEPEPQAREVAVHSVLRVRVPDLDQGWQNWDRDFEALCANGRFAYLINKPRAPLALDVPREDIQMFAIDLQGDGDAVLVGQRSHMGGWPTAADLSPDGRHMVILIHRPVQSVWLFPAPQRGQDWLAGNPRRKVFHGTGQIEAVCFADSQTLLIVNEDGYMFRLPLDELH